MSWHNNICGAAALYPEDVAMIRSLVRERCKNRQDRRSRSLVRYVQDLSARLAMNGVRVMALKAASVAGIGHFVRADHSLSKPDE